MADTLQKVPLPIVSDEGEWSKKPSYGGPKLPKVVNFKPIFLYFSSQPYLTMIWRFLDCRSVYGEDSVAASMVCAGWPEGGKDSCQVFAIISNEYHT